MFEQLLHLIWIAVPLLFFLWALWARLESRPSKKTKQEPGMFLRQGFFLAGCVAATFFLEAYFLEWFHQTVLPAFIPMAMLQILLLPFVAVIGAKLVGGTPGARIQPKHKSSKR